MWPGNETCVAWERDLCGVGMGLVWRGNEIVWPGNETCVAWERDYSEEETSLFHLVDVEAQNCK